MLFESQAPLKTQRYQGVGIPTALEVLSGAVRRFYGYTSGCFFGLDQRNGADVVRNLALLKRIPWCVHSAPRIQTTNPFSNSFLTEHAETGAKNGATPDKPITVTHC